MLWLIFALLEPMLHAFANIFDTYLTNRIFKSTFTLVFYAVSTNVLFLPLIWLLERPDLPAFHQIPFFLLLGLTEIGYLYPYYKSLQHADTSVVTSLFSLGKIFVPVFAFLWVGEILTLTQYAGFLLIIICGALLTVQRMEKIRVNKSFLYMGLCSIILAFEVVLYKYIFIQVSWSTGFTWATVSILLFLLPLLLIPRIRKELGGQFHLFKQHAHFFVFEEFLTFSGSAAMTYAISLTSVSLVEAIGSFQPFFVLVYAVVLGKYFPRAFKEDLSRRIILKKVLLFLVMVVGVGMIVG